MSNTGKTLSFDPKLCNGCGDCEKACETRNETISPKSIRMVKNDDGSALVYFCLQCDQPLCKAICSTDSIKFNESYQSYTISDNTCIRCRSCSLICPYDGVFYDNKENKMIKCDLCGGSPRCVKVCKLGALTFNVSELTSSVKRNRIAIGLSNASKSGLLNITTHKAEGDIGFFTNSIFNKSEGIRKFLDYCHGNLSTISESAALAPMSESISNRRKTMGLCQIKRPKDEIRILTNKLGLGKVIKK